MGRSASLTVLCLGALHVAGCGGGGGNSTPPPQSPTVSSVSVKCASSTIQTGQTSQCSASVAGTGSYGSSVTWSATSGTISSSGLYTAPATVPASGSDTIKATSTQDVTKSGTASITVANPTVLAITISDLPAGTPANVIVTDPNGQQATLTSTEALNAIPGTYTIVASPVVVGTITYHSIQTTQMVTVTSGATSTAIVDYYDIVPGTTKVLDQAGQQSLTVSPDGSTVNISGTSEVAQSLQVGDVLASVPTPSAPNGLLVNILSVSNNGSTVAANVSQATLAQAIQQGSLTFTQSFIPVTSQSTGAFSRGSKVLTIKQANKAGIRYATDALPNSCTSDSNTFIMPFSYTIGAQGGISVGDNGDDASGQVWLDGTLELCPQLQVNVQWSFLSLKSASVIATFGQHALATLKGQLTATLQVEHDFDNPALGDPVLETAPTVVLVGDIPVVVRLKAFPFVGASLSSNAGFYASGEQDAQAEVGLSYANGVTTPIFPTPSFAAAIDGASLDGDITGQVDVGLKFGALLYETFLPNVATDVYISGTGGPPETLSWGLEGNVGMDVKIIGTDDTAVSLNSPEFPIFNKTIWEESGSFDPSLGSLLPNAANEGSSDVSVAVAGSNFVPDSVVNFNGIPLSTTFSGPGNMTAIIPGSDLLLQGAYPITVTSPDTIGAVSNAIAFTVNGSASNPIPSIKSLQPASLSVGAASQTLTINGSGFLSSSTVTFNGISHSATLISPTQLTISLTSSDLSAIGTFPVVATNPPPGGSSAAAIFSVTAAETSNEWTWMSGSSSAGAAGVYGEQGVPSVNNIPGSRYEASSWTDHGGNLWLFGGQGRDSTGVLKSLNDLWEFDPPAGTWVWLSGSKTGGASAVYGVEGVPATSNVPGARILSSSWIDSTNHLWLFGGQGVGSNGVAGFLDDLWEFDPDAKTWTWVSGSSMSGVPGVYGTQGVPSTSNVPGSRYFAISWIDSKNNLWLFGGEGEASTTFYAQLDDLWEFNPAAKTWTWVSGSSALNVDGVYGTKGVPSSANAPGSRSQGASWLDSSGNLWLFGGIGWTSSGGGGVPVNDLWKFDPNAKTWVWVAGSSTNYNPDGTVGSIGIYGTQGVASPNNTPGGRTNPANWIDSKGVFWLFGGTGYDAAGTWGALNDLWKFDPSTSQWTWTGGSNSVNAIGTYGMLGVPASPNIPGSRYYPVAWSDGTPGLWMFGGEGYDSRGVYGTLNDLWRYQP